jgi:hypothetical protein
MANHQNSLTEYLLTKPPSWVHLPGSTDRSDVTSAKMVETAGIEHQNFSADKNPNVNNIAD